MFAGSVVLLSLFLTQMLDTPWAYGSEANNCTAVIAVKRGTNYSTKPGDLVSIQCQVTYCQEKPWVQWHKQVGNGFLELPVEGRHKSAWIHEHFLALNISPVHMNDSGLYFCKGQEGNQTLLGHPIEIIVQGENNQSGYENTTDTTVDHEAAEHNKKWILYILPPLGALCLLIVTCFSLLYSTWRHQVKNKNVSSTSESEMNVSSRYTDAQRCNDSTFHVSEEESIIHHGVKPSMLQIPDDSPIYYNEINCWKATRTTSQLPYDHSAISANQPLPAAQETLVYATLNHEEHFHKSEPSVETECIEYATISLKK